MKLRSLVKRFLNPDTKSAKQYYLHKLSNETDPSDVYSDIEKNVDDFIILDVRSEKHFQEKHLPNAINLHHSQINERKLEELGNNKLFIVYCWGPGCNGSTKAALKISGLDFPVKELIGGIEYWEKEGYPTVSQT